MANLTLPENSSSPCILLDKKRNFRVFTDNNQEEKSLDKGEVSIDVKFSGINFADSLMKLGLYPDAPKLPFTPGYEVSGIISEVGSDVEGLKVGDRVMAGCNFGGYSSKIRVPHWQAVKLPEDWKLEEGASFVVSYLTAFMILFEQGRVRDGDKILIDCATGSLGSLCLKLLKNYNVELYGLTSSPHKKKKMEEKGYKAYTIQEFKEAPELTSFDLILNSYGGQTVQEHFKRLAPNGRMVCIGISAAIENGKKNIFKVLKTVLTMPRYSVITLMNSNKGVYGLNVLRLFETPEVLISALKKMDEFSLRPDEITIFSYKEIDQAMSFLTSKKSAGKVVLSWD